MLEPRLARGLPAQLELRRPRTARRTGDSEPHSLWKPLLLLAVLLARDRAERCNISRLCHRRRSSDALAASRVAPGMRRTWPEYLSIYIAAMV